MAKRLQKTLRVIDANLNRAREAARVAEEYARFGLDADEPARRLKELRHGLGELARSFGETARARDTAADVGTAISTPSESARAGPGDVAAAAFKRLGEALRVIEEYAKTGWPEAAKTAESLRYRAYEIEAELLPARRLVDARLYVIVTTDQCEGRDPAEVTAAAIRGGAGMIQLREKSLDGGAFLELARRLRRITTEAGVPLIVNDRADIAAAAGADGVHLGQTDLPAADARALLGPGAIIGISTHDVGEAQAAEEVGADYLGVGAVFPTDTKAATTEGGLGLVREMAGAATVPFYPIGGIDAENVASVVEAGADRVAVCRALVGAADVEAAARRIRDRLPGGEERADG
ncbi:MAG: thiamine phosphate synthase [Planctomycetota bacterium]